MPCKPRFYQQFPRVPALLPVIGSGEFDRVVNHAGSALDHGADGVFVSADEAAPVNLRKLIAAIRASHPHAWLGLSFARGRVDVGHLLSPEIQGVSLAELPESKAECLADAIENIRQWHEWEGLIFGRLAWNDPSMGDHAAAAVQLSRLTDVIVLEQETWEPPLDLTAIEAVKHALGDFPVGVTGRICTAGKVALASTVQSVLITSPAHPA